MADRLQILHLEDDALDAELVALQLARDGISADFQVVHTAADFEAALRDRPPDLILADYALPGYDGLAALTLTHRVQPHVPYIFVTGEMGEELAIETLKQGATDYVLKTRLSRLPPAVRRAVAEARERAARRAAVAAARAEREWLRVTLASIGDAVIATDTRERVTLLNPVAEALTGWPQAEAVGQPVDKVFHIVNETTRAEVESPVRRVLRQGAAGLANHTALLRRDGSEVPIEDSAAPIRDGQDQIIGVVLVFRDVTARRSAERALQGAHAAAQLSARRLQRLLGVSAGLARAVTPADVIRITIQQGLEAVGAGAGAAFLRQDGRPELTTVFALNYPDHTLVPAVPLDGNSPAGEAFLTGQAVWVASAADLLARYPARRGDSGYEAIAAVPLVGHAGPRGVLGFSFAARKTFEPDERQLLASLAEQCVQALERSELYAQAQRLNVDLDERVRERTAALNAANRALAAQMDEQRNAERKMEQWREAERERMARELHDELGGNLTALKMDLARAARAADLPAPAQAALAASMSDIDTIIDMVRHIAYELRPAVLDHFGLLAALRGHLDDFVRHTGLTGDFETTLDELPLDPDAATTCYRIFQEALTNVARHARASRVVVEVSIEAGQALVRVADNGLGMPPETLAGTGRLGLVGMRERAQLFGGQLMLTSTPGAGTVVALRLPLAGQT